MINILLAKIYFEALVPSIPSWVFVIAAGRLYDRL
ncbi:Putrescine importer [Klebsiella pneumoniae]|nr:Putrescine importer [Klebsiella pneumoniae]